MSEDNSQERPVPKQEPIIWRKDLPKLLGISAETIRRYIQRGTVPMVDVYFTNKMQGWKLSTLQKVGLLLD